MNAVEILVEFGREAKSASVLALLNQLRTLHRPCISGEGSRPFHDWILIRRQGLELGFADAEYHSAGARFRWGTGPMLLTQAYFYSGQEGVDTFSGVLPFDLSFSDNREAARAKLRDHESSRHSHIQDTWDAGNFRLTISYKAGWREIDRLACRVMAAPISRIGVVDFPSGDAVLSAFGTSIHAPEFKRLWGPWLGSEQVKEALEAEQVDLTQSFGATLGFASDHASPIFRSITLHRNRDAESAGWSAELPHNLNFDDSPEALFVKVPYEPAQQSDSALTGHAVWHFEDYTLHVLYSNVDNRLLRVKVIAPGTWKCIEDSA